MAQGGAQGAPFGIGPAVAEFDEIQGVLHEDAVEAVAVGLRVQRGDVLVAGELAGDAVVQHGQRRGAEPLGHQQVLVEADVLRGPVAPVVAEADALLARADGILPEHLAEVVRALGGAAAREAHELGMQVFERLQQVLAERAVPAFLPEFRGLGNEGDEVQPEGAGFVRHDREAAVHGAFRLQRAGVLLPAVRQAGHRDDVGVALPGGVFQIHGDGSRIVGALQVQAQIVTHALLRGDGGRLRVVGVEGVGAALVFGDAVAVGRDAETLAGLLDVEAHAVLGVAQVVVILVRRIEVVLALQVLHQRLVRHGAGAALRSVPAQDRPAEEDGVGGGELPRVRGGRHVVGLEGVVLDQLRADAAVHALVDVLEEDAGQGGAHLDAQFARLEGEGAPFGRLESLQLEHLFRHAVAHQAHAFGVEVELVARALAAERGDHVSVGHHFRQVRQHHVVERGAHAVPFGILQLAGQQRDLVGVEPEFGAQVVVDLLHAARPRGVVRVGLALVQEHPLDHAVLLRLAGGFHQAPVGAHPVLLGHVDEPAARRVGGLHREVFLAGVLVPEFKLRTRDGHVDHAHAVLLRQLLDHLAAEKVHRAHVGALPADGRHGRVPVVPHPLIAGHVHRRHELETRIIEVLVLLGRAGGRLHVGLAEAQVDEEIGVGFLRFCRDAGKHRQEKRGQGSFHK